MKTILLCFCFAYVNAQLDELMSGALVHLGSFDTSEKVGNLSERYTPLSKDDLEASKNARNLIEEARRIFGIGFYTLPPVDPYFNPSLPPIVVKSGMVPATGKVYLLNCELTGAKKFQLNLLELRLKSGRADFGLALPRLDLNIDVETDLLFADILPLNLNGHLTLSLQGLSIVGAVQTVTTEFENSRILQLVALHSRVHIDDISLQFKGSDLDISDLLGVNADESSGSLSELVNSLKDEVTKYVAKIFIQEANKVLTGASVQQILTYLLPDHVADKK